MQDRPDATELIRAAYKYIEQRLLDAIPEHLRYNTLIVINLLKIVERERQMEESHLQVELSRLVKLLKMDRPKPSSQTLLRDEVSELNAELCQQIQAGGADTEPQRSEVFFHVRQTIKEKLEISNPNFRERA